ncbi:MAG TPA: hypothetical protein VJ843_03725 [Candidatus Saccharimonadales bacterium]|nr:hypothetical protein [Candidatus Saccharimonadales bacterium]
MNTGRKLVVFGLAVGLAAGVVRTTHPATAPAVAVLIVSGLIGWIWEHFDRESVPYAALVLFGVTFGVALGLLTPFFTQVQSYLTP